MNCLKKKVYIHFLCVPLEVKNDNLSCTVNHVVLETGKYQISYLEIALEIGCYI